MLERERRQRGPEQRPLGTGTGTAVTAPFDPTVLNNGPWIIAITATGSDGGQTTTETGIIVDGQLKLGRFSQTFQDMSVPVGGGKPTQQQPAQTPPPPPEPKVPLLPNGSRVLVAGGDGLMHSAIIRQAMQGYYELEIETTNDTVWVPVNMVAPQH